MPTVFLAYARANKTVVHEIANDLSAEGLDVSWDDDLESEDWRRELRARIKAADHLVWIMSRQSSHSKEVRAEFDIATEAGTHTHVLCIDGVEKEATDCVGDDVLALNWIPRSRLPKLIRAMRGTPGRPHVRWAVAAAVLAVVGLVSVVSLSGGSGTSPRPRKLKDGPTSTPQSAKLVDGVDDRQESEPESESLDAPPTIGPKEREQETGPFEARLPTNWPTGTRGGTSRAHASHFHLTGEYDVYVKGEKVAADVLFSQWAASYIVTLPDEKHAHVLRQRSRTVGQVALESLKRRDDGYVELSPRAPMKALGRFWLAGQDVVIHVDGFDGRLKPRPPLLKHHTGPELLAHSPQYAIGKRSYRSNANTIRRLKSGGYKAEVEVFFGSWCSRCPRLLGHVLYVEEALGKSGIAFKYYGLPRPPAAWSEAHYHASGVHGLPTAVVRVDGKVRGRIAPGGWSSFELALLPLVR